MVRRSGWNILRVKPAVWKTRGEIRSAPQQNPFILIDLNFDLYVTTFVKLCITEIYGLGIKWIFTGKYFLWWVDPGGIPGTHQRCPITLTYLWTGEREYNENFYELK